MLLLSIAVFCLLVASTATAKTNPLGRTKTGDVGDALEIALPLATLATTWIKNDVEGTKEFTTGLLATLGSTYLLKESISKERPDGRDDDSFPSSHTAVSFHAAAFIHERYGVRWALPVYATAAWVGYSRVHDDRHDEQDVIVGAALGYAMARIFTTQHENLQITPAFPEGAVGVQVSYRF